MIFDGINHSKFEVCLMTKCALDNMYVYRTTESFLSVFYQNVPTNFFFLFITLKVYTHTLLLCVT